MWTELSFAFPGVPQQIGREDNNHMVIFNLESSIVLKNGQRIRLVLKVERYPDVWIFWRVQSQSTRPIFRHAGFSGTQGRTLFKLQNLGPTLLIVSGLVAVVVSRSFLNRCSDLYFRS